ncbi:hypothetical protein LOD99_9944 [Oopsacas minuta]|uniref:Uncharacterized protein n=1 Tax=Oopsacas minuta TaxID=111878 RepID=A0AAV7KJY8_9METZ|nr:hypothetical protein LOD99_9944 [Oopsacas minuta]
MSTSAQYQCTQSSHVSHMTHSGGSFLPTLLNRTGMGSLWLQMLHRIPESELLDESDQDYEMTGETLRSLILLFTLNPLRPRTQHISSLGHSQPQTVPLYNFFRLLLSTEHSLYVV